MKHLALGFLILLSSMTVYSSVEEKEALDDLELLLQEAKEKDGLTLQQMGPEASFNSKMELESSGEPTSQNDSPEEILEGI